MKSFNTLLSLVLLLGLAGLLTGCDPNEPTVNDVGDFQSGFITTEDESTNLTVTVQFWVDLDFSALEDNEFYLLFDTETDAFDDGIDYYARCLSNTVIIAKGYPYDSTADILKGLATPTIATTTDGKTYTFEFSKSFLDPVYNPDYTIHYWFESKTGSTIQEHDRSPNTGFIALDF